MHELSIARSIAAIAENALPENSPAVITGVNVQIGELSSIEIDSLEFAFSILKENTRLEKANLHIQHIPGEALCAICHSNFHIHTFGMACPVCSSYDITILKGREMKVLNIIVDEP